jgi:hypothetical protein
LASAEPAAAPSATTSDAGAPPPPTPRPAAVASITSQPAAPRSAAPANAAAGFLPLPDLRSSASAEQSAPPPAPRQQPAPKPQAAPAAADENATLQERMLAGSTPPSSDVANSYASASPEQEGLTGMVLRLIRKDGEDPAAAGN